MDISTIDLNSLINPGCGVLMNLDYSGSVNDYIDITWSDENAQDIGVIYFETDILNNNILITKVMQERREAAGE